MNNRGAYFYVIDALIASTIILITIVAILNTNRSVHEESPSIRLIEGFSEYLLKTPMREVSGPITNQLINDSNITNLDQTIMEQILEFHYYNKTNILVNFVNEVSQTIIPSHRSFSFSIDNELIFNQTITPVDESNLMISSKRIGFKRINQTIVYGPAIIEARLWI